MLTPGRLTLPHPFFSIGVTTYNRHDLLRETLASILGQSFTDFEIIVGNDYTEEQLTLAMLGLDDQRIRIINHPVNLREVGNMNALLAAARGRYFTWLFDDDLHEPDYLALAHDSLTNNAFPTVFFPSFSILWEDRPFRPRQNKAGSLSMFEGHEFLSAYFSGRLEIVSTSGLFHTDTLRQIIGPLEELCGSAIGLYSEYLLLVRCGLLKRIAYMDTPLIVMRRHDESWSQSNRELYKYHEAGETLLRRSAEVFRQPALVENFTSNLLGICRVHLYTYACKSAKMIFAQEGFGVPSIYQALSLLSAEISSTETGFTAMTHMEQTRHRSEFFAIRARLVILTLIWMTLSWVRTFRPNFLKRSHPDIPG
jgi:glycosyltransferase involved in cell wall biosynthesis